MPEKGGESNRGRGNVYKDKEKPTSIRESNITAAKGTNINVRPKPLPTSNTFNSNNNNISLD